MFKQHNKIIITGSGQSLNDFVQPDDSWTIICVNNSINHPNVKHCNYWFTLDLSQENRNIILNQHKNVQKYVAYSYDPRICDKMKSELESNSIFLERVCNSMNGSHQHSLRLQEDPNKISTGNSLYGALNLAYHMNPNIILLCGLDGVHKPKFDGSMSRSLNHLPKLFQSTVNQFKKKRIRVYNTCMYSTVDCFTKLQFNQVISKYK